MTAAQGIRSWFYRFVCVVASAGGLAVAVAALFQPGPTFAAAESWLAYLRSVPPADLVTGAAVATVVALLALLTAIIPGQTGHVFEAQVDGGVVEYGANGVSRAIQSDLSSLNGVGDAKVWITSSARKVRALIKLETASGQDPQAVAASAANHVKQTVERLGLEFDTVRISVDPVSSWRPATQSRPQTVA